MDLVYMVYPTIWFHPATILFDTWRLERLGATTKRRINFMYTRPMVCGANPVKPLVNSWATATTPKNG